MVCGGTAHRNRAEGAFQHSTVDVAGAKQIQSMELESKIVHVKIVTCSGLQLQ